MLVELQSALDILLVTAMIGHSYCYYDAAEILAVIGYEPVDKGWQLPLTSLVPVLMPD